MAHKIADQLCNFQFLNSTNISLSKAILLFYLIIAINFTRNLYSGQMIDYFSNNRFVQHLIGFIAMLVIIMEVGNVKDIYLALIYSFLAYIWFILTTKLDIQWNLAIIGLLLFGFLYNNQMEEKEQKAIKDKSLNKKALKEIKQKNLQTRSYILLGIIILTLIGLISYIIKKKNQYGGNFDTVKFLFEGNKRYKLVT